MATNQPPWPRLWLMTDERFGDRLWQAIDTLPVGAGVVFRHYWSSSAQRRSLGRQVALACKQRGLSLAIARDVDLAEELGAGLVHNPPAASPLPCSLAVHDEMQAMAARRAGAVLAFVAPIHPTRSHPDAPALGIERAAELARMAGCPAIALGGMDTGRFDALQAATSGAFHGYAGIDCWLKT